MKAGLNRDHHHLPNNPRTTNVNIWSGERFTVIMEKVHMPEDIQRLVLLSQAANEDFILI